MKTKVNWLELGRYMRLDKKLDQHLAEWVDARTEAGSDPEAFGIENCLSVLLERALKEDTEMYRRIAATRKEREARERLLQQLTPASETHA